MGHGNAGQSDGGQEGDVLLDTSVGYFNQQLKKQPAKHLHQSSLDSRDNNTKGSAFWKDKTNLTWNDLGGGGIIVAREMTQLHIWKFVEDEVEYLLSSLRQQMFGTLLAYSVIRNHWNFLYSIANETTTSLKSNPVVPSDLNFYWFLWHVASIVISITGIVYLVSCTVPFSNQRSCQERHRVFLTTS